MVPVLLGGLVLLPRVALLAGHKHVQPQYFQVAEAFQRLRRGDVRLQSRLALVLKYFLTP